MSLEREAFEKAMKSKCIFDLDYVQYHEVSNKYVIQSGLSGDEFKIALDASHVVNTAWLMWQAATQREGWKFVPVEPTEKMIAMGESEHSYNQYYSDVPGIYKAMIEAV